MAEYIEREAAKEAVKHIPWCDWKAVGEALDSIPAADVEVVKHGRWEKVIPTKSAAKWSNKVSCSICHKQGYTYHNYCPNCGCKMDLEVTNGLDQH